MFDDADRGPVLVLAPHPDDETLGTGGLLLRLAAAGRPIHWLIATQMDPDDGWPPQKIARRKQEIAAVRDAYGFAEVHQLPFAAARLDRVPVADLVGAIGAVVAAVKPAMLLLPHRGDAHSDHATLHDAGTACTKWFRYPSVRCTLVYETLSETDVSMRARTEPFQPDIFVDITPHLEKKLDIARLFGDEIQPFPFPRSIEAIRALAQVRGAACGAAAAEAFMLLGARI